MIKNLKINQSIILSLGDITLEDTNDTFYGNRQIENIHYTKLLKNGKSAFLSYINCFVVSGDHSSGTKITIDGKELYYAFGVNRPGSNADSISIGYKIKDTYYFILEYFTDVYDKNPTLTRRDLVKVKDLWKNEFITQLIVYYHNWDTDKTFKKPIKKEFKDLLDYAEQFENAFARPKLKELRDSKYRY